MPGTKMRSYIRQALEDIDLDKLREEIRIRHELRLIKKRAWSVAAKKKQ